MARHKKITKEDIDFPNYCYFFIKEISDSLKECDITNPGDELTLDIESVNYPYCYDAMSLIVKTFERKHYMLKVPTYKVLFENDKKIYAYKWKITKLSDIDDLPF